MKIDRKGLELIERLEGLKTKAYKCSAGVWTIGIGSTYFENGEKVSEGDAISKEEAYRLFELTKSKYEKPINESIKVEINQNQFNALFCFCYNIGAIGFKNSTVVRKINENASKQEIINAFMMWKGKAKNKSGQFILESRRQAEINEYFKS